MLNYVGRGKIVNFVQLYDTAKNNKPKIKCYKGMIEIPGKNEKEAGYGALSRDINNKIHVWGLEINPEHLNKYRELRNPKRPNRLEILMD